MRKSLKWSLVVTSLASVAALWLDPDAKGGGAATIVDASAPGSPAPAPSNGPYANWRGAAAAPAPDASAPLPSLASTLPDRDTEAGRRDIFAPVTPPAPPPPPPPPPAPPPPPPPPPAPPAMNWRALGSMVTPAGERIVWLAKGNDEITVKPGAQLDDGYVVQSVDADKVVLSYPSIGTTATLSLPHGPSGSP
jgi:hypothetical protein